MADEQESKHCSNCKRQIASGNFIMHEVHCRRNIVLCDQCHEPVPRSEMEAHFDEYHAKVTCQLCSQKFEKSVVDEHKSAECPKRNLNCEYCQLDMPACDLNEHKEYCGARTEQCALCRQFIMHRDQNEHELSMCTYPPLKNSPVEAASSGGAAPGSRSNDMDVADDFAMEHMNPFAMTELSRILQESSLAPPMRNNITPTASRVNTHQGDAKPSGSLSRSQIRPRPRLEINRNVSRTSKNTNHNESAHSRRANANNRQPKNQPQNWARGGPRKNPSDLDEILARHLAADLSPDMFADENFGENTADSNTVSVRHELRLTPPPHQDQDSDEISLPCEFCGEPFPVEYLFEHQNACNPNSPLPESYRNVNGPVDLSPRLSPSDTYPKHVLPNNSPRRSTTSNSQPPVPHIVDNLSMLAAHDWFSSSAAAAGGMDGETMLPCEFCDQLFPDDLLVQHQAVCEIDPDIPPPPHSPNSRASSHSLRSRSNVIGASGVETSPSSITPRASYRRQGDPVFNFRGTEDELPSVLTGLTPLPISTTRGRLASMGRSGSRMNANRDSNKNKTADARSTTRGRGICTFPGSNSRYTRRGSGVRGPPQPATRFEAAHARGASPELRRQNSATCTNRTLEQLLKDPNSSTDELLAAMDKEEKSNRNQKTKDQAHAVQPHGDHGDLSLSSAVNGGKLRRLSAHRQVDDLDGVSGYDPSFAATSHSTPRISNKPKPGVPRASQFAGASNLRVGKPRTTTNGVTSSRGADSSVRPNNPSSTTRKRTNSRPRKAPQGEP